ncbi:MAG: hypothetical protein QM662_14840 [Gordonia sp. (in: high G+C Gram-positive bacteria)]
MVDRASTNSPELLVRLVDWSSMARTTGDWNCRRERMGATTTMHWVVIETGSNQSYIFATNKQRLQVAASAAVWSLGYEWIGQAIEGCGLERAVDLGDFLADTAKKLVLHVVEASGRAVLLVHDAAHGKNIISDVTRRALEDRTGIDVWGSTGAEVAADLADAPARFFETDVLLREQRTKRRAPGLRFPTLPFHEQCAYTSRPAVRFDKEARVAKEPGSEPAVLARSDVIDYLFSTAPAARKRLMTRLIDDEGLSPEEKATVKHVTVGVRDLGDGLSDNGWIGVIHADGNGIGKIFANLRRTYRGADFVTKQRELSAALEELTWQALRDTVVGKDAATGLPDECATWAKGPKAERPHESKNAILPIIVGGDDISAAVSGRFAFEFAVLLVRNFCHYSRDDMLGKPFTDALSAVKSQLRSDGEDVSDIPDRLSLALGVVFTKPNHPFVHAITIAEELTGEAKKKSNREFGAIDTHTLFESAIRDLHAIRADMGFPAANKDAGFTYAGSVIAAEDGANTDLPTVEDVRKLIHEVTGPHAVLSRGQIQDLKEALTESKNRQTLITRVDAVRDRIDVDARDGAAIPEAVAAQLPKASPASTLLVSAIDLAVVAAGTVEKTTSQDAVEKVEASA